MTIRLSGEMRAQTILEARKKAVSMEVLQLLNGKIRLRMLTQNRADHIAIFRP
jgi:hypothetical protein